MLCMKLLRRKLMRVQSSKVKAANRGLSKSQGLPGISGTATITITTTMTVTITIPITIAITSTTTITHVLPLLYISVTISIVMLRLLLPTTNIHDILNAEDIETVEVHLQRSWDQRIVYSSSANLSTFIVEPFIEMGLCYAAGVMQKQREANRQLCQVALSLSSSAASAWSASCKAVRKRSFPKRLLD